MMIDPYNDAVSPESNVADDPGPRSPSAHRRILSLDFGSKTIGLAVSDPLGLTGQGLPTLRRKNKRTDFEALGELIRKYEVAEIVLGLPLHMRESEMSIRRRGEVVDRLAAVLILQSFLESRRH
jgi:putative Holliday junction resolvase